MAENEVRSRQNDSEGFPVEVTPKALEELRKLAARKAAPGALVRVGVKGGGCSGLEYVLRFEMNARSDDLTTSLGGLTLVCDPKSAHFLQGSVLEYTGNLLHGGFAFQNPNAERSCGCGTSFAPKAKR
jgi:iron-sulfur cluster assembly protein